MIRGVRGVMRGIGGVIRGVRGEMRGGFGVIRGGLASGIAHSFYMLGLAVFTVQVPQSPINQFPIRYIGLDVTLLTTQYLL